MVDENGIGAGVNVTVDWLAAQVERAFALAGVAPTVVSGVVASSLLKSHDEERCADLQKIPASELDVNRVLAHLVWLKLPLPPRVAGSIARRLYVALINRDAIPRDDGEETEFCAECGQTVPKGEPCRCES